MSKPRDSEIAMLTVLFLVAGYPPQSRKSRFVDYASATSDEQGNAWFANEYVNGARHTDVTNWATCIVKVTL